MICWFAKIQNQILSAPCLAANPLFWVCFRKTCFPNKIFFPRLNNFLSDILSTGFFSLTNLLRNFSRDSYALRRGGSEPLAGKFQSFHGATVCASKFGWRLASQHLPARKFPLKPLGGRLAFGLETVLLMGSKENFPDIFRPNRISSTSRPPRQATNITNHRRRVVTFYIRRRPKSLPPGLPTISSAILTASASPSTQNRRPQTCPHPPLCHD